MHRNNKETISQTVAILLVALAVLMPEVALLGVILLASTNKNVPDTLVGNFIDSPKTGDGSVGSNKYFVNDSLSENFFLSQTPK